MILRLSKSAKRDLQGISQYTQKTWELEQEELYLNALFSRLEQIKEDPKRWRNRDELFLGSQSAPIGKHVIFFNIQNEIVQVARILHQQMDFVQHLDVTDFEAEE